MFVNENCCPCKYFTELYFFYWLVVVSLAIFIAVPFVFSRSWTSLAGVLKMPHVSNAFSRIHIIIKLLNKKINIINSLLCWSVNLFMFIQTLDAARTANLALVKSYNRLAVLVILKIFWTVSLKAHDCSS